MLTTKSNRLKLLNILVVINIIICLVARSTEDVDLQLKIVSMAVKVLAAVPSILSTKFKGLTVLAFVVHVVGARSLFAE
jgi:hypothetical protein